MKFNEVQLSVDLKANTANVSFADGGAFINVFNLPCASEKTQTREEIEHLVRREVRRALEELIRDLPA